MFGLNSYVVVELFNVVFGCQLLGGCCINICLCDSICIEILILKKCECLFGYLGLDCCVFVDCGVKFCQNGGICVFYLID